MSGRMARNKGKRAERQVIDLLQPVVDWVYAEEARMQAPILQRNTLQSDFGGHDISGLEWLSLEVKHQEQRAVPSWWQQCCGQAAKWGIRRSLTPVLWYRRNGEAWNVRMYTLDLAAMRFTVPAVDTVDITAELFQIYLYRRLRFELGVKD